MNRFYGIASALKQHRCQRVKAVLAGGEPAGVALILGGFFSILPVFGLSMLPLGLILLAEDLPIVRRGVARVLDWLENRWPHWFARPDAD